MKNVIPNSVDGRMLNMWMEVKTWVEEKKWFGLVWFRS